MANDILIIGSADSLEEALCDHNRNLRCLFERLSNSKYKLNISKLNPCKPGFTLTIESLKPDACEVEIIKNIFISKDKVELSLIENVNIESGELRQLSLKQTEWHCSVEEDQEFHILKIMLVNVQTLRCYNLNEPVIMECDSSSKGLGAIIYHNSEVVAMASRILTISQQNYAMIEKDLLSLIFGCTRSEQYLIGNPNVTVRIEHFYISKATIESTKTPSNAYDFAKM